jgi:hypothetical protein
MHREVKIECILDVYIIIHFWTCLLTLYLNLLVKELKNAILSAFLYECETAVRLKQEHGLILFKNKFLRRMLKDIYIYIYMCVCVCVCVCVFCGVRIKKNEMEGACNTRKRNMINPCKIVDGEFEVRDNLEDLA